MRHHKKFLVLLTAVLLLALSSVLLTACKKDTPDTPDETPEVVIDETPAPLETYTFSAEDFPRIDGAPGTLPLAQAVTSVMLGLPGEDTLKDIYFTGSTHAFRNLAGGLCDIALVGELYPPALDEITGRDFRCDTAPIAVDALVFIVSQSNPVDNLTSQQVRSIYNGSVSGWQEVGGNDLDIFAFQRNEEATSQVLMEMLVMDWEQMADAPMQFQAAGSYGDDSFPTAKSGFDSSVNAIGYTMYHYASVMGMAQGYKILSIDGVQPSNETIANGTYPFTSPYFAYINMDITADDNARILFNWLTSDDGQDFISAQGYVSVKEASDAGNAVYATGADMRWNVITDDSKLTPYESPRLLSTRLHDGALPVLEPSANYGKLLPYSTAVTMNDGSIYPAKYGLVTAQDGIVVTDPIYDAIDRVVYSTPTGDLPLAAYRLHMHLPQDDPDYGFRTIQAMCADDGSWITPFSYTNIIFRQNAIFCMYSAETFDIDVYDYDGNLLYNILDLEWAERISENTWPEYLMYSEGDGYAFIQLDDGTFAVMDIASGSITETDFSDTFMFSYGLAAVKVKGSNLWGFVNTDLELVIDAKYARESAFANDRAIVEAPDGRQLVINKDGEELFSLEAGFMLSTLPDYHGYIAYSIGEAAIPSYFTYDFKEIEVPAEALPLGPEDSVSYVRNGWFTCKTENGSWLYSADEVHNVSSSIQNISEYFQGFIVFGEYNQDSGLSDTGVMTLDGTIIVPALANQSVTLIPSMGGVSLIAVNTDVSASLGFGVIGESYTQAVYKIIRLPAPSSAFPDTDLGNLTEITDTGVLSFDTHTGYIYIQGNDYFAWMDAFGETFISIPSMGYSFD